MLSAFSGAIAGIFTGISAAVGPDIVAIILTVLTLIVFAMDRIPIGIVAMVSSILFGLFGCMSLSKIYSGWSSSLTIMLLGMMIVGYSMFETGAVVVIGRMIMKSKAAHNEKAMIVVVMLFAGLLSAVLSNTAVVGTFIPLIGAMVAASGGKLKNKHLLMPLGYAASIGGTLTVIGSTSQPMVNTCLEEAGLDQMAIFDLVPVAGPAFIITIIWMVTIGYSIMKKTCDFEDVITEADPDTFEKFQPTTKTWIAIGVLIFCVVGFFTSLWNIAVVAIIGASICLLTGCCTFKDAMTKGIEWNSIFIMAFAQGIAAGMNDSGAGERIARFFVSIMGSNSVLQLCACILVVTVLTNIMSNTATAAMMTPIYILIAQELGVSYMPFAIGIAVASNLTTATPIGGTAVSMTLQGGYRFNDFVKVGLPLNIIIMISVMIMTPLCFSF